jgi:hypothetical protein
VAFEDDVVQRNDLKGAETTFTISPLLIHTYMHYMNKTEPPVVEN